MSAAALAQGPLRSPATPLVVRDLYLSTWQGGDSLSGIWPSFWTGSIRAVTGIARVDGQSYVFLGAPYLPGAPLMAQCGRAQAKEAVKEAIGEEVVGEETADASCASARFPL